MGVNSSSRQDASLLSDEDVNFDHFQILRNIGKGSFGKVCIVQKRDNGNLFAMKYVSRSACIGRGALGGVLKEVELLASLEHPFLVNLWFSFQDEEDLFMVCDLLAGGDLRYHLNHQVEFSEASVALLVCEIGSALDYLQKQRVVHRDIKPDNILLDEEGHAHLTDFNIATRLPPDGLACSMSGTKPYMAPEVFMCALEEIAGYSYPVDWWSLGVVAYEMRSGMRPFVVHSSTPLVDVKNLLNTQPHFPRTWSDNFIDLLGKLLNVHPGARISSQRELQQTKLLRGTNFERILAKQTNPLFKPSKDHLNCDPSLELEEMIIETKPLHKKKKRLAKQRSIHRDNQNASQDQLSALDSQLLKEFLVYNRFKEQKRKAMEKKETEWQQELDQAMASSEVDGLAVGRSESVPARLATISEGQPENAPANGNTHASNNGAKSVSKQADNLDYIDRTPSPKPSI
ncbi:serine/threonine-protein kinase 32A [Aedes aegypti]|uniref:Protein kinase domain-containing protein n=1 Tax=Aedes aegypti TaxID=7159 RepID=A0A6I8T9D1_AEDAE|nr:serine/threonine-protein kinase 32A [Aedes aegypti]XP_021693451.1 serine/threonine-protein kinase 32A [Aedes aegypti]XP_021693456.1 serine/threonine-protein kinase 32A [Aedes aegypti]XP_021693464.1 serine/threonine-protein kinase 32A [Aedes aegypti]XP_021693468.1 serine/threonine-protein kinase 32A [Aedes aegypti]XP_021693471.1 serine/threonine-protein kinase 32A [Aedes aegypti]XP_021693475.1 serine/threonine-protein kinase 32A [Aedes aegypti]XP_021693480.1 serine/threonine-protein kinase